MQTNAALDSTIIPRENVRAFVCQAGQRYGFDRICPQDPYSEAVMLEVLGRGWTEITLPAEYATLGVQGKLLVDAACLREGEGDPYTRCDWFVAAFSFLSGVSEWHAERENGPLHSYAFRLKHIPEHYFDYAWANRILLLMRSLEAARTGKNADALFGPVPTAQIQITHDVDALDKTTPIRVKQTAFELFNMLRSLLRGQIKETIKACGRALKMVAATPPYYHLDTIADMVSAYGKRSCFHLYVHPEKRSWKLWLMDPGYRLTDARLQAFVAQRSKEGFTFGIHPSFDSWANLSAYRAARDTFQNVLDNVPTQIRQHWLRFSWRDTWRVQAEAGFTNDCTLGFNDRSGFRTGAALSYHPWDFLAGKPHAIIAWPMVMMDSHFYSYHAMTAHQRKQAMQAWIAEIYAVAGEATLLWHPHTFAPDYGWQQGFRDLLDCLRDYEQQHTLPESDSRSTAARTGTV